MFCRLNQYNIGFLEMQVALQKIASSLWGFPLLPPLWFGESGKIRNLHIKTPDAARKIMRIRGLFRKLNRSR